MHEATVAEDPDRTPPQLPPVPSRNKPCAVNNHHRPTRVARAHSAPPNAPNRVKSMKIPGPRLLTIAAALIGTRVVAGHGEIGQMEAVAVPG